MIEVNGKQLKRDAIYVWMRSDLPFVDDYVSVKPGFSDEDGIGYVLERDEWRAVSPDIGVVFAIGRTLDDAVEAAHSEKATEDLDAIGGKDWLRLCKRFKRAAVGGVDEKSR